MRSMTGFARAQGAAPWGDWVWEVRSVNGRSMDVRIAAPPGFDAVEFEARRRLKSRFVRGSFQATLRIEFARTDAAPEADPRALRRLAQVSRRWATAGLAPASVADALAQRSSGARTSSPVADPEAAADLLLAGLGVALDALDAARAEEGKSLAGILSGLVDAVETEHARAVDLAGAQPELVAQRFRARLAELTSAGPPPDPDRVLHEAALLAARADVREELDRLKAHAAAARLLIASPEAVGRKLDFLSQELNREANTLASKSASLELTNTALALKSLIEQFREQAQNVE